MIYEDIKKDFMQARKDRDNTKSSFYSWIIGQIQNTSNTKEYTDDVVLPIIQNIKKKLAEVNEQSEVDIIDKYLPKMLTEEEIRDILLRVEGGMKEKMTFLKDNYAFQYDGKLASQIARE